MEEQRFLLIGKIVGVHGIKGNIKVYSYAESILAYKSESHILIKSSKGFDAKYTIEWSKPYKRTVLLSLKGVNSRGFAETLVGSEIFIEKINLPDLQDGSYYWFDIIGLVVFTTDGKSIGTVESIIPTGANDVYVVKASDNNKGHEVLIPALESVVVDIDLIEGRMTVDLPEGL